MIAHLKPLAWAITLGTGLALSTVAISHDHGHSHDHDHGHAHDHGHDDHGHDDGHRQLGTHVHGVATLTIAQDGEDFVVELDSPSINVVSFEHTPNTDAQRAELERALELLKDASNVVQLTRAGACELEDMHVESDQLAAMGYNRHGTKNGHGHGHDDHGHDDHGHDDHGHDDHGHDDHGHDHDHAHSDFEVEYIFHCDQPSRVIGVYVPVFDHFPGFEAIDVQWIVNGQQGAARATAGSKSVLFR